jgi:hypothetical protein
MVTQSTKYLGENKNVCNLNMEIFKTHIIFIIRKYNCVYGETQYHKDVSFLHLQIQRHSS